MKGTRLYNYINEHIKCHMGKTKDTDYYVGYLTMWKEGEWFYTNNGAHNPLPNQYSQLADFASRGFIQMLTMPLMVNGVMKGTMTFFRYKTDMDYEEPKI